MDRLLALAGVVVVLGAASAVLAKTGVALARLAGAVREFLDDWRGEEARPGAPRRPGVPERLQAIEGRLVRVEAELKPNDGRTLRDAVNRVENAIGGPL